MKILEELGAAITYLFFVLGALCALALDRYF